MKENSDMKDGTKCLHSGYSPKNSEPRVVPIVQSTTYMLRCADNSIYTGISTDLQRRFEEHLSGGKDGAKYTKSRAPLRIERAWTSPNRSSASKLEYALKKLSKSAKEELIRSPEKIYLIFNDKLNCKVYNLVV